MCLCCFAGCAAIAQESPFTREMVEKSLVAVGNTQRLHRVMEKAKSGEEVTIAYLGGSITEGASAQPQRTHCYAALSAKEFAETYMPDPKKLHYVNAGISGTPSLLGVTRLQKDVLSRNPDIVFVEFAVNDSSDNIHRMAYESLVINLLKAECQPAVILIFTVGDNGYSQEAHMKQIGRHYELGMISVRGAINTPLLRKQITWADYGADSVHPNNRGHRLIADMIAYYYQQAESKPSEEYVMPEKTKYGNFFEGLENILPGHPFIVSEGGFPYRVANCYSYLKGWVFNQYGMDKSPLVMRVDARRMTIVFKQENSSFCGDAEVWVDGVKKLTLQGNSEKGWGNPVTQFLHLGEGVHDVEIRMAEGHEKKRFTILDMGYVQ